MVLSLSEDKIIMTLFDWRDKRMFMSNKTADIAKGMGIGLAVGTVAAVAGSKMMTKSGRKMCKRTATKCMNTMEDVLDSISSMMR